MPAATVARRLSGAVDVARAFPRAVRRPRRGRARLPRARARGGEGCRGAGASPAHAKRVLESPPGNYEGGSAGAGGLRSAPGRTRASRAAAAQLPDAARGGSTSRASPPHHPPGAPSTRRAAAATPRVTWRRWEGGWVVSSGRGARREVRRRALHARGARRGRSAVLWHRPGVVRRTPGGSHSARSSRGASVSGCKGRGKGRWDGAPVPRRPEAVGDGGYRVRPPRGGYGHRGGRGERAVGAGSAAPAAHCAVPSKPGAHARLSECRPPRFGGRGIILGGLDFIPRDPICISRPAPDEFGEICSGAILSVDGAAPVLHLRVGHRSDKVAAVARPRPAGAGRGVQVSMDQESSRDRGQAF